ILLALLDRVRTGKGRHIDVALFDSLLSTLSMPVGIFEATGEIPQRLGNDHASIAPYEVFRAEDGLIVICAGNERLWSSFCDAIDRADLVDHVMFRTNADRVAHRTALTRELAATLCTVSLDELIQRLEERSVPCGRVRSIAEALADPQVSARAMLCGLDVSGYGEFRVLGNPIKISDMPPRTASAPPRLGE